MAEPHPHKHALVTGASRGIGAGIARSLAAIGYAVTINYRQGRDAAEAVADSIRSAGGQAHTVAAAISDLASLPELLAQSAYEVWADRHPRE